MNKENTNIEKYNTLMPESDDRTLCFEIHRPISKEGYQENYAQRARVIIEKHGGLRLLTYYTNYQGWEPEAALMNMAGITEFGAKTIKFAMVNPPNKEILRRKVSGMLITGETRIFETSELQEALRWVKE